jgi:class III poly(R)-hydroxyalkanoic acid synthase PhaE subunit
MSDAGSGTPEWAVLWQELLNVLTNDEARGAADAADLTAWQQFGATLAQQVASGASLFAQASAQAGDVLQAMNASAATDGSSAAGAAFFSSFPGGLWHKEQQSAHSLQQAMSVFLKLQDRYNVRIKEMLANAMRSLTGRIRQQRAAGKTSHTAREIYDQWISAGEESFATLANEPQFIKLQGDLINALINVRRQQQASIEPSLRQVGLPTRADVDSLRAQIDTLRAGSRQQEAPAVAPARKTVKGKSVPTKRATRQRAKSTSRARR